MPVRPASDARVHAAFAIAVVVSVVALAGAHRDPPRCPEGLVATGARCCGEGQRVEAGLCVGAPTRCGVGQEARQDGCVAVPARVPIGEGAASWKSPDTSIAKHGDAAKTAPFAIDAHEITWSRWRECVDAKACPPLPSGDPGQAVSGATLDEARAFCRWAGGRLPSDAEWLRAAIGAKETRYPWGDPDALCLRAAFALDGRCARGAVGPDTAGARPWGATPSGVHDLAGNVAEWVEGEAPTGHAGVRGGSWKEPDATALRPRWRRVVPIDARLPWVGFRCVY